MPQSVLIVDDHQIIGGAIKLIVDSIPQVNCTKVCTTCVEATRLTESISFDLCIVDVELPDGSGLELVETIRQQSPLTKMLISTMHDEIWIMADIIRTGVNGMILKSESMDTYKEAITALLNGQDWFCHHYLQMRKRIENRNSSPELSKTEMRVLRLIIEGYSTREMAEMLYRSPNTIESHRRHIMNKLEAANVAELINKAYAYGFNLTQGHE